MRTAKGILAGIALAVCAACGQTYSLTGTAVVNGTVNGLSMTANDAVSSIVTQDSTSWGEIVISASANQCDLVNAHQAPKSTTVLVLELGTVIGNFIHAPTVGTYNLPPLDLVFRQGNTSAARFVVADAACGQAQTEAASGTIVLTRAQETGYEGSFNLTFVTQDGTENLSGTFDSGTCSALTSTWPAPGGGEPHTQLTCLP